MDNTQLPIELQAAIQALIDKETANLDIDTDLKYGYYLGAQHGIEIGAKEYAIKMLQEQQAKDKAHTLLGKVIYRHEGGLLPCRLLYNEIKTFLNG